MKQVLYPFGYRYFMGVEDGSCERIEPPSAGTAEVFLHAVFPPAVLSEGLGSAERASRDGGRVDHRGLLGGDAPVLLGVPFGDGGIDHRLGRRKGLSRFVWVRPQRAGPAWVAFIHVWRFACSGGRLSQTAKSECPGSLRNKTLSDLWRGQKDYTKGCLESVMCK